MGEGEERLKSVKGKDWACLKKLTSPNRKKTPMMRKQKPINALQKSKHTKRVVPSVHLKKSHCPLKAMESEGSLQ